MKNRKIIHGFMVIAVVVIFLNYVHFYDQKEINIRGERESAAKCICFGNVAELEIYPVRYVCEGKKYCKVTGVLQ